jgi:hypothetical protein
MSKSNSLENDEQIRLAEAHMPKLVRCGQRLIEFGERTLPPIPYDHRDPTQVMVLAFVSRQLFHLKSIRALIEFGAGRPGASGRVIRHTQGRDPDVQQRA